MQSLKPSVWIGKKGCTDATIQEIIRQLKDRRVVKVKWLRNTEVDPAVVAERTGAEVVSVRGRTMVLAARPRPSAA
ncbi:MAG: YhbY family RNA-binding protein [Methanobacteriota archaeon]|nr:MAG: YhbY family RNA-binding protein [Euryarchaeota archaeon]